MPKGVPKAGFRLTKNRLARMNMTAHEHRNSTVIHFSKPENKVHSVVESVSDISARIAERFEIMTTIVESAAEGHSKGVIISGPPGVGKSYEIERVLKNCTEYTITKGFVRATGLFKLLWGHREPGQVIVFDDSDSIFNDEIALNLLKAVCDTTERRIVSWLSQTEFEGDDGEIIPRKFEFQGTIIFITNLDFDNLIAKGNKLAPHLEALLSRAHYVDLSINTPTACLIRVQQVIEAGMFNKLGFSETDNKEILDFMTTHVNTLREISLRMAVKLATLYIKNQDNWQRIAKITCCKSKG